MLGNLSLVADPLQIIIVMETYTNYIELDAHSLYSLMTTFVFGSASQEEIV